LPPPKTPLPEGGRNKKNDGYSVYLARKKNGSERKKEKERK
jgi:hypothetical protein